MKLIWKIGPPFDKVVTKIFWWGNGRTTFYALKLRNKNIKTQETRDSAVKPKNMQEKIAPRADFTLMYNRVNLPCDIQILILKWIKVSREA